MSWLTILGIILYILFVILTAANFYQLMIKAEFELWKSVQGKGVFALIIGGFWPVVFLISIMNKIVVWVLDSK